MLHSGDTLSRDLEFDVPVRSRHKDESEQVRASVRGEAAKLRVAVSAYFDAAGRDPRGHPTIPRRATPESPLRGRTTVSTTRRQARHRLPPARGEAQLLDWKYRSRRRAAMTRVSRPLIVQ